MVGVWREKREAFSRLELRKYFEQVEQGTNSERKRRVEYVESTFDRLQNYSERNSIIDPQSAYLNRNPQNVKHMELAQTAKELTKQLIGFTEKLNSIEHKRSSQEAEE